MKLIHTTTFAVLALVSMSVRADPPVITLSVGGQISPGVYGQVQIGNLPPPPLLFPQPVIIERHRMMPGPIYLHVPPGHARKWSKHCYRYNACNREVYFVRSSEYDADARGFKNKDRRQDRDHRRGDEGGDRGSKDRGGKDRGRGD